MTNTKNLVATVVVAFSVAFAGCGDGGKAAREKEIADSTAAVAKQDSINQAEQAEADSIAAAAAANAPKTVVVVADSATKTLAAAIKAAELEATLNSEGPFTVFAPNDAAFAAIQATVDDLLKPENKEKLQSLLKGHVIAGSFSASTLKDGQEISTAEGTKLKVKISGGKVTVNGATVVTPDVKATNGVIHIIDKVLVAGKK